MADRVRIKICGLTTTQMIDEVVDAGADAVGVVLSPSKRQVTPQHAAALLGGLQAFVAGVAVYRHPDAQLVAHALNALPAWAMHQSDAGDFSGALCAVPESRRVPVVRLGHTFERNIARHEGRTVLVEGRESGTGTPAPWHEASPWIERARIIIAGGLTIQNVGQVVRALRPFAVDVSSGVERQPGVKDIAMVRDFIAAVRDAERG